MSGLFRRAVASLLLSIVAAPSLFAQSKTSQWPVHPIHTISPTDTSFQDLEFLRQEIGAARVVMLGEPSHGEGNVFEAKARLMRFLQQRMGFTTVAFESGFYELDKAQRQIEAGTPVREAIDNSVFPVWTSTREFQAVLPLLGKGRLRVAGFDSQLSGAYQEELVEELEAFLKPEKGADGIAYDYLEECLSTMGETFIFPPTHQILLFNTQVGKARRILEKVAAGTNSQRRARAAFWLQTLRSLQALAHDYATNDSGAKSEAEFKATDSNPRDAQMADNLLWYLRQHPQEKVICWGALPHLSNKAEVLEDAEIKTYKPMGRAVKAALGSDAVYVLGTLAGGGTHGFLGMGKYEAVPVPAAGTLEASLLELGHEYSFVSLKHDAPGRALTTYAFEYKPYTGLWSEVVDGFLFLKSVNPPHAAAPEASEPAATNEPAPASEPTPTRRLNPAGRSPTSKAGAALVLTGSVLDRKTGKPIPFASVAVPARSAGTIADAQGRFRLEARQGEVVQVSSIGYEPTSLSVVSNTHQEVRLAPAAFALGNVRVSAQSQDPRRIMKRVIKAMETNYEQQDYTQQLYTHRRIMGFDTLRNEVEYTGQQWTPAGYRHWAGGFLMLEDRPVVRVQEKRVVTGAANDRAYSEPGYGFSGGFDPVRISPLFKTSTVGKFRLQLDSIEQRGTESYYVIGFAAKRASHRATGLGFEKGYSGRIYVRQQDYAVVRYESLWQHDTTEVNAIAHKYYGTKSNIRHHFPAVFQDHRATHVVTYQQASNGRYYAAASIAQAVEVGHVLGRKPFYNQKTCDVYYTPPVVVPAAEVDNIRAHPELHGSGAGATHPEFWQTYQRPVPIQSAPELKAIKP
ncbi:erythromycin esterase family protein [Hymenobacter sp. HSC-4F20]|uniref:erythromycin esterase family protein n=1 Tax=Hymenobacter sp. HSC-4F20 TaxID=2864135 RepID=UPI001C731023|nr:erythromycin esterase family protein [Hymenobacter sp. HSC-4F20]MBX0291332.1 erythromycin esterase family protein [Hymenobacter sp. HSC-4F20]